MQYAGSVVGRGFHSCVLAIGTLCAIGCTITTTETKNETVASKPRPKPAPKPAARASAPPAKPKPEPKPPTEVASKDTPPRANVAAPSPQPEQSQIVLPVKISLEALSQQIEALVPKDDRRDWTPITKPGQSPKADVKVQIWREPIKVSFSDHTFHITVPVRYAANIRAQVKNPLSKNDWIWIAKDETWGTRAEPQHLSATFDAKLDVDEAWHVKSDLKVDDLKHGDPPSGKICKNVGIEICVARADVAPQVNERIDQHVRPRLRKALAQIDAKLEKAFNLQARAQSVWNELQSPQALQIPGAKQPAWLVVTPSAVGLDRPELEGSDVRIGVSIAGRIAVHGGAMPKLKAVPLPKLSELHGAPGFHVVAELNVPDDALSAALERELHGLHVGKGKQQLTLASAQVIARADAKHPHRIAIKVALAGAVQDEIEMSGELVYVAAAQRLSVEHFDYAADSDGALAKKLAGFDHEAMRKQIAAKAKWDLAALAAPLKKAVTAGLNASARAQLHVSGELDQLDLREFTLESGTLNASVVVGGALQVDYTPR